ncbi:MAG: 7-cyano-7-deazaguanine synthase QueC [Ferroplasma sp.]|uniref:7-cyano-7-deazaguanine synthase QueC n=1 Tax=Ferroplasma sp. TaxID=2591003 RepID=UPI0028163DE4|nr:7-cyano-7-deazaguanine synthase QueC [Ferroplasma sp.]WMT51027.1 MAG: 7-cyano-7-deazaguanine synthase QueC [Ferroplasma sp.]
MEDKRAVVLISGGLDSPTVLAYALDHGYRVFPLSFDYGQRHAREVQSSEKICSYYGLELKKVNINLRQIGGSALTDDIEVPERGIDSIDGSIPVTYVPARNTIFISLAAAYGEVIGAGTIFIGANAIDYSGYPDCRPDFYNAMERTLNLGTEYGIEKGFKINVPLQYLTKADIVKLGRKLGVPYKLTWSCYNGREKACGRCDSCILRLKGFMEAGDFDDIEYEEYPDFYFKYLKSHGKL